MDPAEPPSSTALAAIDLGTNSFHLLVARVTGPDRIEVIGSDKEMVRLGSGAGDMKLLLPEAMDRGVAALRRFRSIADASGAEIRAVATSALREADNRDEFVHRARDEAGVDVEVISGIEEARLIHLGALRAVPVYDRRALFVDIGGGSTEVLLGERAEVMAARSFKLGAIRLTDRFFAGSRLHPGAVSACRRFIAATVAGFAHEVQAIGFEVAVGSSGTIGAAAALAHARTGQPAPRTFNRFELTADALDEVVRAVIGAGSTAARRKLPGMDPARVDIVLAGLLILEQVMAVMGAPAITYSDGALREGVLLDTVQRRRGGTLHHLQDLSRRSVRHLAELCDDAPEHSEHVARLALRLFDQTAPLHGLDEGCREYLEAGALLANVGVFVAHAKHHLHSYYVIRNSERLTGFTDAEIEVIAQVARYHRKSAPKPSHAEFAALSEADQHRVRVLAALLRVAIGLDRHHDQVVQDVVVRDDHRRLHLDVIAPLAADIDLELFAADSRKELLEQVLDRRIVLTAAAPQPA